VRAAGVTLQTETAHGCAVSCALQGKGLLNMLIITRYQGESIRIAEDIVITISAIGRSQVRLAIEAPKSITVHREEVAERIRAQQCAASARGMA